MNEEQAVLGALIIAFRKNAEYLDQLKQEYFTGEKNRHLYDVMKLMRDENEDVDLLTLSKRIDRKIISISKLPEYTNIAHDGNIEAHIKLLKDEWARRLIMEKANELVKAAYSGANPIKLISEFDKVADQVMKNQTAQFTSVADEAMEEVKRLQEIVGKRKEAEARGEEFITGIESGIKVVDMTLGGFQDTDLIILAARPGMGKTSFALTIANNAGIKHSIGIFSLEMSDGQLVQKLLSMNSGVNVTQMRSGMIDRYDWDSLIEASGKLEQKGIFIDDTPGLTIEELKVRARIMKRECGIKCLVVDYLQLMSGEGNNRVQIISEISRGLKLIAKELKIPVIALSQLSRAVEQRQDKRPMLSDLRESGSIEQDADIVCFLYRDSYYNPELATGKDITEFIISKNRHGIQGIKEVLFVAEKTLFTDIGTHNETQIF